MAGGNHKLSSGGLQAPVVVLSDRALASIRKTQGISISSFEILESAIMMEDKLTTDFRNI